MALATTRTRAAAPARTTRSREIALFPRQLAFVNDRRRYVAFVGGLGSGKTFSGGVKALERLPRREVGLIAAPTYPMLRDSTQAEFFSLLRDLGIPYEHNKSERSLMFDTGHRILLRSLDEPDDLRGPNLSYAWIDEAAYVKFQAWRVIKARVRVGSRQQVWLTTTPKGRNWIYDEFVKAPTARHGLHKMTTYENTTLDPDYAESLGYVGRFAEQELGGEFVAFDGLVYSNFDREKMVRETGEGVDLDGNPRVDVTGWRTIQAGDVGSRNPTAILTIHFASDGRVHVSREFYQRNLGAGGILGAFTEEAEAIDPDTIYLDPSAKAYIDDLLADGYPAEPADNEVDLGIQRVTTVLSEGFTIDPACVHTIAEFESYQYPEEGKRGPSDKPVKQNDHTMDALRYGVMGAGDVPVDLEEFYRWQR